MPKVVAQADLDVLRERMAARVQRAKADDPHELRRRIEVLETELRAAKTKAVRVEIPVLRDAQLDQLAATTSSLVELAAGLQRALKLVASTPVLLPPASQPPSTSPSRPAQSQRTRATQPADNPDPSLVPLRAGERRMLETLVRHHPMKMTRAQPGTIAYPDRAGRLHRAAVAAFLGGYFAGHARGYRLATIDAKKM